MTTHTSPTTSPLVSGLNHAAIVTADLDRLVAFYVDVFDAEVLAVPSPPGTRSVVARLSATSGLALMEVPGNPHAAGSTESLARGHLDHVALDAPTPGALEELRRRLVARGATDGTVNDYGPMLSVHFEDPDGMGCEVCWVRDPSFADAHPPVPWEGDVAALAAAGPPR